MPRAQSAAPPKPKLNPQPRLSRAKSAAPSKPRQNQTKEYSHATKSDEEEYIPKDKNLGMSLPMYEYRDD